MSDEQTTTPKVDAPPAVDDQAQDAGHQYTEEDVKKLRSENAKWRTDFRAAQKQLDEIQAQLKATTEASETAKQKELQEQGKWRELAEAQTKKLAEVEGVAKKVEKYNEVIGKLLTQQREGLPEAVIALLDRLEPADQLDWLAANKAQFLAPVQAAPGAPTAPRPPTFNPTGTPASAETDAQRVARLRRSAGQTISPFGGQVS